MKKSPLFRIFQTLTSQSSSVAQVRPFPFDRREDVVRLFDLMDKYVDSPGNQLDKARAFPRSSPASPR